MSDDKFTKLANDTPAILREAGAVMRKVAQANIVLEKKASDLERENRAMKLARRMEIRGVEDDLTFEEKVAKILELPETKLAAFEAGIEFAASGARLGAVQSAEDAKLAASGSMAGRISDQDFDNMILSGNLR